MRDEAGMATDEAFRLEVAEMIVDTLVLEDVTAPEINPEAPLFGDGLGLDSIDALELAFAIAKTYGFKLRSDDQRNKEIFASLDALARHIAEHRTQ
ncbi:MAG: phosphopantetheine-binding protein [Pseudomonadota bacterium]